MDIVMRFFLNQVWASLRDITWSNGDSLSSKKQWTQRHWEPCVKTSFYQLNGYGISLQNLTLCGTRITRILKPLSYKSPLKVISQLHDSYHSIELQVWGWFSKKVFKDINSNDSPHSFIEMSKKKRFQQRWHIMVVDEGSKWNVMSYGKSMFWGNLKLRGSSPTQPSCQKSKEDTYLTKQSH